MIMKVVAYKDTKLNVFAHPIYLQGDLTNEDLIEQFRRMCASPDIPSVYFDYDIYLLGNFDDKLGTFETYSPEYLCSLADYRHLRTLEENKEKKDELES